MTTLREQLRYLGSIQSPSQTDRCRLFYDGSVRTRSLTLGEGEGWMVMAAKIIGAGPMFSHFFVNNDEKYLNTRDLRQALELRDQMLIEATQERTLRTMKQTVRKEYAQKVRKEARRANRLNVTAISQEEPKQEEREETREEDRIPTTIFF